MSLSNVSYGVNKSMNNIQIEKIIQEETYGNAFFKFVEQNKIQDKLYRANFTTCEDEIVSYEKGDVVDADLSMFCIDKFEKQNDISKTDFKQDNINNSSMANAVLKIKKIENDIYGIIDNFPQKIQLLFNQNKNMTLNLKDDDIVKVNGILNIDFND